MEKRMPIMAIEYMREGNGKSYALAHAIGSGSIAVEQSGQFVTARERTVHFEPLYEHHVSPAFIWGMAQAEARRRTEPQLHLHNIIHNIAPRPRDPATTLAGTVFDPRRYRNHNSNQTHPARP